jgi:uncharacterized protein (TIGR03435 family)
MKTLVISLLALAGLDAQPSTASFEVATVKASPANDGRFVRGCRGGPGTNDPGLFRCTNATLSNLIMRAYDIRRYQLAAPGWIYDTNYEISAKLPLGATKDQLREMIANLLADRFKLQFHWSKKEMGMYDMVINKGGPRLKESVDQPPTAREKENRGATDAEGYPNIPDDCDGCLYINAVGKASYHAAKAKLKDLVDTLAAQLGMPINDQTGLTGQYDITLSWSSGGGISPRPNADASTEPGITMEAAVVQQLGLRLVPNRGLVDIIVFDRAEKIPAEN